MNPDQWEQVYAPGIQEQLRPLVQILSPVLSGQEVLQRTDLLEKVDVIFSGWGGPVMNERFLANAPHLRAVFHGAGAARHLLSQRFWDRKISISTANAANAVPVSEFTLAHILLGLKRAWGQTLETKRRRSFLNARLPVPGAYRRTVGLVSLSTIGRLVRQRLSSFDLDVLAYDPTISEQEAADLNVRLGSLAEVFANSEVVSLHSPLMPETSGMITGELLASMKTGATFINTARGQIVREKEMIEVLRTRLDLTAVLDVTDPEPPSPTCELFDLPNAIVTPHIAGSLDGECERMGQWVVDELRRFLKGEAMLGQIWPDPIFDIPAQAMVQAAV